MVDLSDLSEHLSNREGGGTYKSVYNELSMKVVSELQRMYRQGYIWSPPPRLSEDWKLEQVFTNSSRFETSGPGDFSRENFETSGPGDILPTNDKTVKSAGALVKIESVAPLYRATWRDPTITAPYGSISGLLLSQMSDPTSFRVPLANNDVLQHQAAALAMELQLQFGSLPDEVIYTTVLPNTMSHSIAKKLVSSLGKFAATAVGTVVSVDVNRIGRLILLQSVLENYSEQILVSNFGITDSLGYRTQERRYRFSILLPYGIDVASIRNRLLMLTEREVARLEKEYLPNLSELISLYEAIERGIIPLFGAGEDEN